MLNSVSEKVVFSFLFLFARLIDWVLKQGVVTARLSLSKSSRALDVLNGYIENAMAQHTATSRNQIKMQANEPVKKKKKKKKKKKVISIFLYFSLESIDESTIARSSIRINNCRY